MGSSRNPLYHSYVKLYDYYIIINCVGCHLELAEDQAEEAGGGALHEDAEDLGRVGIYYIIL